MTASDGTGLLPRIKYTYDRLKPGSVFLFFGKPNQFNGRFNMVHPKIDNPPSEGASGFSGVLTGVYNSTDRLRGGGVTGKVMNRLMAEAIDLAIGDVEETLPEYVLREKGLVPLRYAIRNVHFPSDQLALDKARYRLKWEELFLLQLSLLKQKYSAAAPPWAFRCRRSVRPSTPVTAHCPMS